MASGFSSENPTEDGNSSLGSFGSAMKMRKKASFNELRLAMMGGLDEIQQSPLSAPEYQGPAMAKAALAAVDAVDSKAAEQNGAKAPSAIPRSPSLQLGEKFSHRKRKIDQEASLQHELARPVQPLSPSLSSRLSRECEKGIEFLMRLQEPPYSRRQETTDPMLPQTALRFSKVRTRTRFLSLTAGTPAGNCSQFGALRHDNSMDSNDPILIYITHACPRRAWRLCGSARLAHLPRGPGAQDLSSPG